MFLIVLLNVKCVINFHMYFVRILRPFLFFFTTPLNKPCQHLLDINVETEQLALAVPKSALRG